MVLVTQMMADFIFKPFSWQLLKSIVLILGQSKNTFWIKSKELTYSTDLAKWDKLFQWG